VKYENPSEPSGQKYIETREEEERVHKLSIFNARKKHQRFRVDEYFTKKKNPIKQRRTIPFFDYWFEGYSLMH
jgi:hypothetical protein